MTPGAITTLANVATLLVLLMGAAAALVQLRHLRAANALQSIIAIESSFAQPQIQRALLYVQNELPERLTQPQYRSELAARGYIDPHAHPEMEVCNWFNDMGTKVEGNFLDEAVFLDAFGRLVEYYWSLLVPVIALLRRERGPDEYAGFALIAYRARRWREQRRTATGQPFRMELRDPWASIDRHAEAGRR